MKLQFVYDYHDDRQVQIWYVITLQKGELPWDRDKVYILIEAPFKKIEKEDFFLMPRLLL